MRKLIGTLFALGAFASAVACGGGSVPTATPVSPSPTAQERVQPPPTPTRVMPTPTSVVQLQRPISTTIPTPTPPPTPEYSSGLPFNSILVNIPSDISRPGCTQVITVAGFSRSQNPQREGWDVVEGSLRYHNMSNCGTAQIGASQVISSFGVTKGDYQEGRNVYFGPKLRLIWEGGGIDIGLSDEKIPFDARILPFKVDVPSIAKNLQFELYSEIRPDFTNAVNPDQAKRTLETRINSLVTGGVVNHTKTIGGSPISIISAKMPAEVSDSSIYEGWFKKQIMSSSFNLDKSRKVSLHGRDLAQIEMVDYKKGTDNFEIILNVSNITTTQDVNLKGSFIPLYSVAGDGSVLVRHTAKPPSYTSGTSIHMPYAADKIIMDGDVPSTRYNITFQRNVVPPGYKSEGRISIPRASIPSNGKYLVGVIDHGIIQLGEVVVIDLERN